MITIFNPNTRVAVCITQFTFKCNEYKCTSEVTCDMALYNTDMGKTLIRMHGWVRLSIVFDVFIMYDVSG